MDYSTFLFRCYLLLLTFCLLLHERAWCMVYGTEIDRSCANDHECNRSAGEVCWKMYDGCNNGKCMCDPRTQMMDKEGKCRTVRLGGETCSLEDQCLGRLECSVYRKCFCRRGSMTSDRKFCMHSNDRLLGNQCTSKTTCYQRGDLEYTTVDVRCSSSGYCQCEEGFKEDKGQCRKWNIGESGCTKNHQCQGGALCNSGRCTCLQNYYAYAHNTRCVLQGAETNLQKGDRCDELNEESYCAPGLYCHKCRPHEDGNVCVKYKTFESRIYTSLSPVVVPYTLLIVTSSLTSLLVYLLTTR